MVLKSPSLPRRLSTALLILGLASGCSLFERKPAAEQSPSSTPPNSTPTPSPLAPQSSSLESPKGPGVSPSVAPSAPPTAPNNSTPSSSSTQTTKETTQDPDKALISKLKEEIESNTPVLKENPGKINLNRLLLAQAAQRLVSGSFSSDLSTLDSGVPAETSEYRFVIESSSTDETTLAAIAKKAKLPSYSAAAFARSETLPVSGICQTKSASQTPPAPPSYQDGKLICPANSSLAGD